MRIAIYLVALWALFHLTGCTTAPVAPSAPPTVAPAACPDGTWCPAYDALVTAGLTAAMKAAPYGDLCPNGIDPLTFWPALMSATAKAESGYRVADKYTESFAANNGAAQVSQGLFQLSLDDAKRGVAGCLPITQTTILQGTPNIVCALGIMDQLIRANTKPTLRGNLGRYWSTIRDGGIDAQLRAALPSCFHASEAARMDMVDPGL